MGVNQVYYGGNAIVDMTDATATPERIITGYTAYDKKGDLITGVAKGESTNVITLDELIDNYDNSDGFFLSYDNVTTGLTYITNNEDSTKGVLTESSTLQGASPWYFEQIDGYTNRFYIYTYLDSTDTKYYIYNNTGGGANFIGLSTTSKNMFDVSYEADTKFLFKITTKNAWLQHSNSGGGIRLYTDHNNPNNTQLMLTYVENAIVPHGTLTITENGTYNVNQYKTVIVNIS